MSTKFRKDDLVELLNLKGQFAEGTKPGMIGKILRYSGNVESKNGLIKNAWCVQFPTLPHEVECKEEILRLVPGGEEYRDIGNWDDCPWSPYRKKLIISEMMNTNNPFNYDF